MKNHIIKTGVIIILFITPYFIIQANECREVKLECKEKNKADGIILLLREVYVGIKN